MPCPAFISWCPVRTGALSLLAALALTAWAQTPCSSDGQRPPPRLVERFISADCADCWRQAGAPTGNALALDWIVPGALGDEAPLSAAARREGLERLRALGAAPPSRYAPLQIAHNAPGTQRPLRVAAGPPVNDYVGVSIHFQPSPGTPRAAAVWTSWLALVETLPAGEEGSPVERNLVRNLLVSAWDGRLPLSKQDRSTWYENRSMSIPPNARAGRLRVVGWVQDARGRIVSIAQSVCPGATAAP